MTFRVGERVVIISETSKYKGQCATVGQVHCGSNDYIGVYPDGATHIYFNDGKYNKTLKLARNSIRKIDPMSADEAISYLKVKEFHEEETRTMSKLTGFERVAFIKQGYDGKEYAYALYDNEIAVGDKVIVSGTARNQVWTISEIVEVGEKFNPVNITAEVVCKLDMSAYEQREENRRKAEELRKQMDKKKKEIEARKTDDYYADLDEDYAKMLKELRSLNA